MCAFRTPGFVRAHTLVTLAGFAFLSLLLLAPTPAQVNAATASLTALEDGTAITVTGQHFALRTPVHLDFTSDDLYDPQMNHAAMDVTSDADGNFTVQVPWQMVPPFGCFRNEMVTITGSTADGAVAMTAVCQPPPIVAA